jgi:hypothetical protein
LKEKNALAYFALCVREEEKKFANFATRPDPSLPFKHWKVETVCSWMEHLGLFMYNAEIRKNIQVIISIYAINYFCVGYVESINRRNRVTQQHHVLK